MILFGFYSVIWNFSFHFFFFVSPFCIMYNKDTRLDSDRNFMLDLNIFSFFTSFKIDLLCEDFCMLPIMYHQGFELECFQHLTKP